MCKCQYVLLAVGNMVERCVVTVLNEVSGMTDIESMTTHIYDDMMCLFSTR